MFGRFGKKSSLSQPIPLTMRDTLFGDMPINAWPANATPSSGEPWKSFVQAREALARSRKDDAIYLWQQIAAMPGLESRHTLQAWQFLRQQGVQPSADVAKRVYGVVIEVGMPNGLDLLAAYTDLNARYYNYSGGSVIWEHPNDSLDPLVKDLLAAGQTVALLIGPWESPRPPAPAKDIVRLNMLTPSGLHFGQGAFSALRDDPKAKRLLDTGTALMVKLVELAEHAR